MSAEIIELLNRFLNVAIIAVVAAMVLCVALAAWMTRRRHNSYEDYLASKRRIEKGTRIVDGHIQPLTPWPKK